VAVGPMSTAHFVGARRCHGMSNRRAFHSSSRKKPSSR